MDRQNLRFFFIFAVFFVAMYLYTQWQGELQQQQSGAEVATALPESPKSARDSDLPVAPVPAKASNAVGDHSVTRLNDGNSNLVVVTTDVLNLKIDLTGGDIVYAELLKYPADQQDKALGGVVLLDRSAERFYVAQSGLLGEDGPDSQRLGKGLYTATHSEYTLTTSDADELRVDLQHITPGGVVITKRFIFRRGSYLIDLSYLIDNQGQDIYSGSFFGRLKRRAEQTSGRGFLGAMRTYTGAAVNTPEKVYKKVSFADMKKSPFKQRIAGGWVAMVEHYFTSAWIPEQERAHYYQSEVFPDDTFGIRFISEPVYVNPGEQKTIAVQLYSGPEITEVLRSIAPGLDLTVDYGILWWLCQFIFSILKTIYNFVGNWGLAIVGTTFLIKLAFYGLSARSYRSMGNMRRLQPRIDELKSRYGEDKQKFGQAVMELYRVEKINPLGGCLPILVQIPVFIALYYVLLGSVELRQAPFMLWIHDLAAKDPIYVLPLLMGASMFVQQKMNPTPPDPVQAKIMMFMPVFMTLLFLNFPAGLVLYWLVNNLLSILQQWYITRRLHPETAAAKK